MLIRYSRIPTEVLTNLIVNTFLTQFLYYIIHYVCIAVKEWNIYRHRVWTAIMAHQVGNIHIN